MKRIGLILSMVLGIGMLFSSTCKQPVKINVPSPIDTNHTTGPTLPTTACFEVQVHFGTKAGPILEGSPVYVFNSLQTLIAVEAAGSWASNYIPNGWDSTFSGTAPSNYTSFILPANTKTLTYYYFFSYTTQTGGPGASNNHIQGWSSDSVFAAFCPASPLSYSNNINIVVN